MNKLSISVWFWLWRTDLNLTKDGNPTLTHRTGRKTRFFSGTGALCHLFQHGCEIPEQKSKAAHVSACATFNKEPWFYWQRAGSALRKSSSCWGVRGQTGNIESFQRRKVLKNLKHFAKETSLRTPVTQLYVMKLRSTQDCPIWGQMKDVILPSREYVIPEGSLQRMSSNVSESILFDKKGARCHLFKHGYGMPEQKSKAAARLRVWPFVQHSANNPGLPHKWLAQRTSPIVFSLHRDSQIFPEKNVMDSFLAGSIGVSAQKATTLMPCCGSLKDLLTLRCRRRNIFAAATKWNVWPTFARGKASAENYQTGKLWDKEC